MKVQGLYNIEEDIKINDLKEVTSSVIYRSQNVYNPAGLFSEEIFGSTPHERWYRCGYIKLPIRVFNPTVAKTIIARSGGALRKCAYGLARYNLEKGVLVESPDGQYSGIVDLYKIWNDIDIRKTLKTRSDDNIDILTKCPKDLIFINKLLVLPPNFRPIGMKNGRAVKSEINSIYMKILGYKSITARVTTTAAQVHNKLQDAIVELYTYIQKYLGTKNGFLQKNLLAKTAVWTARNVISAPTYKDDEPFIGIYDTGYPLHTLCTLFNPILRFQIKEFLSVNNIKAIHSNPEEVNGAMLANMYDERAIADMLDVYRENYGARFRILYLDPEHQKPITITLYDNKKQETFTRPLTLTDVVYIAAKHGIVDAKRHCYVVRYPIGNYLGAFFTRIVILSTNITNDVTFNNERFPFYPCVIPDMPHHQVATFFKDTLTPSNSNLKRCGGDYDGDTVKSCGLMTDEANEEAERIMLSKLTNVRLQGTSFYETGLEFTSALYTLTKL